MKTTGSAGHDHRCLVAVKMPEPPGSVPSTVTALLEAMASGSTHHATKKRPNDDRRKKRRRI